MTGKPKPISEVLESANLQKRRGGVCVDCGGETKLLYRGETATFYTPRCVPCNKAFLDRVNNKSREADRLSLMMTRQKRLNFMYQANIPREYYSATFDNYDVKYNNHAAKLKGAKSCAKNRQWVVFTGTDVGVGKTRLATSSLYYAWEISRARKTDGVPMERIDPKRYRFYYTPELVNELSRAGIAYEEKFSEVMSHKAIVLDELGREDNNRANGKSIVQDIIWEMHSRKNLVIATTYMDLDEFQNHYDGGMIDRIRQNGKFITLTGKSYRQRNKGA